MDRSFEQIRNEVLELDRESQGKLVEEIEQHWTADIDEEAYAEAEKRMGAYRRGESSTVSAEESIAHARKIIEDYKKSHS
jgi:hypothetical protein